MSNYDSYGSLSDLEQLAQRGVLIERTAAYRIDQQQPIKDDIEERAQRVRQHRKRVVREEGKSDI